MAGEVSIPVWMCGGSLTYRELRVAIAFKSAGGAKVKEIAELTGIDYRGVQRTLADLRNRGVISHAAHESTSGGGRPHTAFGAIPEQAHTASDAIPGRTHTASDATEHANTASDAMAPDVIPEQLHTASDAVAPRILTASGAVPERPHTAPDAVVVQFLDGIGGSSPDGSPPTPPSPVSPSSACLPSGNSNSERKASSAPACESGRAGSNLERKPSLPAGGEYLAGGTLAPPPIAPRAWIEEAQAAAKGFDVEVAAQRLYEANCPREWLGPLIRSFYGRPGVKPPLLSFRPLLMRLEDWLKAGEPNRKQLAPEDIEAFSREEREESRRRQAEQFQAEIARREGGMS